MLQTFSDLFSAITNSSNKLWGMKTGLHAILRKFMAKICLSVTLDTMSIEHAFTGGTINSILTWNLLFACTKFHFSVMKFILLGNRNGKCVYHINSSKDIVERMIWWTPLDRIGEVDENKQMTQQLIKSSSVAETFRTTAYWAEEME